MQQQGRRLLLPLLLAAGLLLCALLPLPPADSAETDWQNCLACHPDYASALPPISALRQANLGELPGKACLECHDLAFISLPRPDWTHPVRPVGSHLACTQCHIAVPHGADSPPPMPTGDYSQGCYDCHQNVQGELSRYSRHSMDARTSCRTCHPAHEALRAGLPLSLLPRRIQRGWSAVYDYERSNAFCLACHGESELFNSLSQGFVTINTENYHERHVKRGQALCMDCHESHGSQRASLLRSRLPGGDSLSFVEEARGATCTTYCHGVDHRSVQYINRPY